MEIAQWIGLIAGALTTIAFIPQVVKTYRSRSAKDLSLTMFLVFSIGILLWLVYGILINEWPVIIANAITLLLSLVLLSFKLTFKK
jgi:MtN3 and saliva related transmembrane protein